MQLVLWLVGSYAFICGAGYLLHRHFMYFPNARTGVSRHPWAQGYR